MDLSHNSERSADSNIGIGAWVEGSCLITGVRYIHLLLTNFRLSQYIRLINDVGYQVALV